MKKLAVITVIMLLAVCAFGQRKQREQTRPETQNHKSEATVRRSAERSPTTRTQHTQQTRQVRRDNTSTKGKSANVNRSYQANARKKQTGTVRTYQGQVKKKPAGAVGTQNGQGKKKPTGTVRTRDNQGKNKPAGTVRTRDNQGKYKPAGRVRTPEVKGKYKPSPTARTPKGNVKGHAEHRKQYTASNRKQVRKTKAVHTHYVPVKYHKSHYKYRVPKHRNVIWTHNMYREYRKLYPDYHYWYYPTGYRISTIPYYNAYFHIGEVRNVYGRIHGVWYSWATDEYYLYFGAAYPYQNFTVILEGRDARRFSRHPEAYFGGRDIWVTGLVSTFEGKPEIMVKRNSQIHLY